MADEATVPEEAKVETPAVNTEEKFDYKAFEEKFNSRLAKIEELLTTKTEQKKEAPAPVPQSKADEVVNFDEYCYEHFDKKRNKEKK